jgi:hypothetical protein
MAVPHPGISELRSRPGAGQYPQYVDDTPLSGSQSRSEPKTEGLRARSGGIFFA